MLYYNKKLKLFSVATHELYKLPNGTYRIVQIGFNTHLNDEYIMKGTRQECEDKKKELESKDKNFTNGADSVIALEYFNQIKDGLRAIVNISKIHQNSKLN